MGYYTTAKGEFTLVPALSHQEVKIWRGKFENNQWDWRLFIHKNIQNTEQGTLSSEKGISLGPPEDQFKSYETEKVLQDIVDVFPGHEFRGSVEFYGEDSTYIWRLTVKDGKVIREEAEVSWPDGTPVESIY